MSADTPESVGTRTFVIPDDATDFPFKTPTLTAQGAPASVPGPAEVDSQQMYDAAASQQRARDAEQARREYEADMAADRAATQAPARTPYPTSPESPPEPAQVSGVVQAAPAQQDAPVPPTAPEEDVQRLLPDPNLPFALEDGTMVAARHLRLREFLSMLKIVTRGASLALGTIPLNVRDENFTQSLISLFIFAIPEAEQEASEFVRKVVDPVPAEIEGKRVWRSDEDRVAAEAHLDDILFNPDLGDLVSIIETVIRKEGPDLRRLGKRLQEAMAFMQRTGQTS